MESLAENVSQLFYLYGSVVILTIHKRTVQSFLIFGTIVIQPRTVIKCRILWKIIESIHNSILIVHVLQRHQFLGEHAALSAWQGGRISFNVEIHRE